MRLLTALRLNGSFVEMGTQKSGYAIVILHEVIAAKALSPQTSAQRAELIALVTALQLGKDNKLNIFTDSKCGFHMLHAHAAIWKESSVQFSSVTQSCPTLCDPTNRSTPGLPVHHHLPEFTQTHVHRVCDAIQPSHPLSSPSPPALNLSQHQCLFQ